MATTPDPSKTIEFSIVAKAPPTPLALSKKARPPFDVAQTLPEVNEISHLKTPEEYLTLFKQLLLLSQTSKVLYPEDTSLSYRDITSATERDTTALDGQLEKTAESLLMATQELRLQRARNEVWSGATYLEKKVTDVDDPSKTTVKTIDILKTFHEVSIAQMIQIANAFWSQPDASSRSNDGMSQHYICQCFGKLLFNSLTPAFKLLIQNKIPANVILDGPLIWTTIAHTIFPSKHILKQSLRQDLLKNPRHFQKGVFGPDDGHTKLTAMVTTPFFLLFPSPLGSKGLV
jgi:hypothetical protein